MPYAGWCVVPVARVPMGCGKTYSFLPLGEPFAGYVVSPHDKTATRAIPRDVEVRRRARP